MYARKRHSMLRRLFIVGLVVLSLGVFRPSAAQTSLETQVLTRVAEREGVPITRLRVAALEARTLTLTDRQIVEAKVLDAATGAVYRVATEPAVTDSPLADGLGEPLDVAQALQAEADAYRDRYGALHPELARELSGMADAETLTVGLWLKTPGLTALPRPDLGRAMQTAESGDAAPPARDLSTPIGPAIPGEKGEAAGSTVAALEIRQAEVAATIAAAETANRQHLTDQVAALQAPLLANLDARGYQPVAVSPTAPLLYVEVPKSEILTLARRPEVDTIYPPNDNFDLMSNAKPTQKADDVESWGYEGAGTSIGILEDSRIEFDNPYLDLGGADLNDTVRDPNDSNVDQHATATGGMVASQHGTQEGIAQDVALYSANATTYNDSDLSDAMDWAVGKNLDILNNSWGGNVGNTDLNDHDRHLDYIVRYEADSVTVAAGNEANTCGNGSGRVASPARGYNVLSVGGYNDMNSTTWDDDTTYICSSFVDPSTGVEKPEVVASGANILSTSDDSSNWIEDAGSGTSYAAPMVAGEIALLLNRESSLAVYPETVKAIVMATALHNIEGDSELSDIDGAGGVDMRAALHLTDEGWWAWENVQESDFPYTYTQYAHAGETVRAVIAWNSNPASDYSSDPLEADLDLRVYDEDGDFIASSTSFDNSYEIVEFDAPATGSYHFRVSEFSFSGSAEYVGFAFWPGHRRLTPYDPEVYDTPPVSHDNYRINAADHWNAAGLRMPSGHDYDITLYDGSAFGDPDDHTWLEDSKLGGDTLDFVVLDGNHAPLEDYFLEADAFTGSGGTYAIEWATHSTTASDGTYGPYTMSPSQVLRVWDLPINNGEEKHVMVQPISGNVDLGLAIFDADGGDADSWYQGRSQAVAIVDDHGLDAREALTYTATGSDDYGLVAWNNAATQSSDFMLYVDSTPPSGAIHLDGALAYANSTSISIGINVADGDTSVTDMRFSNDDSTWSAWEPFSGSRAWTLTGSDGTKTVYAQFRNPLGMTTTLSDSIILDTVDPSGSLAIDGGASYATSASVTLDLSASDDASGVDVMRFSDDGSNWSAWDSYAVSKTWILPGGDGSKTVSVQFRDVAGNVSPATSDTIVMDTTPPTTSTSSPASIDATSFTVSWSGSDATTSLISYDVQYRVGSGGRWTTWRSTTTDTSDTFGPSTPVNVERDRTYYFRVRARDDAGNVSGYASGNGDTQTMVEPVRVFIPVVLR